ncbi:hypothetical protein [Neptuniibacter sp.]|uniref:hypothetical protein n=1 Tax=Neptuniibacter sp. TaxID=1962643 RepID=UPI003B5ADDF8
MIYDEKIMKNKALLTALICLLLSNKLLANDWPQACYNETSMWVTSACKEYIETVYYAAPGPELGAGVIGLLLVSTILYYLKKS